MKSAHEMVEELTGDRLFEDSVKSRDILTIAKILRTKGYLATPEAARFVMHTALMREEKR